MQMHQYRPYVMMLFRNGLLSSLGEGLIVAGVSKPTLLRWLREDAIDWRSTRLVMLSRYHLKSEARAAKASRRTRRTSK